jgi:hypothetical protein
MTGAIRDVPLLGRIVHVGETKDGPRAISSGEVVKPETVERYLSGQFGDRPAEVEAAMTDLAKSLPPKDLAARAFHRYERSRPEVPHGERGWGAKGALDLARIRAMARGDR